MNSLATRAVSLLLSKPRYALRRARSSTEVEAALRLRFEVFNLELNEGLKRSHATGLDQDEFDAVCDHLIVEEERTGKTVGTYRMQSGTTAGTALGYYSAREFDFTPYEPIRGRIIELGRACVHKEHRSISVISLLWRGIAEYALERRARYLIGCSSLTSQDPCIGAAMYHRLADTYLVEPALRTHPLPALAIPLDKTGASAPPPPKLLRAYLSVGAKICGPPAIDREFGTIDFLTLLDVQSVHLFARDHFTRDA